MKTRNVDSDNGNFVSREIRKKRAREMHQHLSTRVKRKQTESWEKGDGFNVSGFLKFIIIYGWKVH